MINIWNTLAFLLLSWAGGVTEGQQLHDNITNVNMAVTLLFLHMLCSLVCSESQHCDQEDNLSQVTGMVTGSVINDPPSQSVTVAEICSFSYVISAPSKTLLPSTVVSVLQYNDPKESL